MDYVKYYAGPLISTIGLAGFLLGGNWVWLGFTTFPAITLLDALLPREIPLASLIGTTNAAWPRCGGRS